MNNKKIFNIAFFGILSAIIIVLMITGLAFINIGTFASITILHIPVLIGAFVLGKKYGVFLGFIFGMSSMIMAFILAGPNLPFTNPLLSVLPRMVFGFIVYPLYLLFSKLFKNKWISSAVTFGLCTFIHTILVVTILFVVARTGFFFYSSENPYLIDANMVTFIVSCISINCLIEVLLAIFVASPIAVALRSYIEKKE